VVDFACAARRLTPGRTSELDRSAIDIVVNPLFGTDHPVLAFKRTMDEIDALALNPEAKRLLLRDNALRVYGLGSRSK
jgi:hypothetical protein